MKQTAVEWLEAQLKLPKDLPLTQYEFQIFLEKAKEMEKQQIIDAYTIGSYDMTDKKFEPNKYYLQTFKK